MLLLLANSSTGSYIKDSTHASTTLSVVEILISNAFVKDESKSPFSEVSRLVIIVLKVVGPKPFHPPFQASDPSAKPINEIVFKDSYFEKNKIQLI